MVPLRWPSDEVTRLDTDVLVVGAGPAETGPFMLTVIGAVTGACPTTAHPASSTAHDRASSDLLSICSSSLHCGRPVHLTGAVSK